MDNYQILDIWDWPEEYCVFAFETEQCYGGFASKACAFLTGCIGDLGVGVRYMEEHDELFPQDDFDDVILYVPDDDGYYSPAYEGRINENYGVFIFFKAKRLDLIQKLIDRLPLVEEKFNVRILNHYVIEYKNIKFANKIYI